MGRIATSPLFVHSLPGPLLLSPLWEVLPLWEEGRSTSLRREVLPGFFIVSLALALLAGSSMLLLVMVIRSSSTAALLFHQVAPSGRTDVAAP